MKETWSKKNKIITHKNKKFQEIIITENGVTVNSQKDMLNKLNYCFTKKLITNIAFL